jgi:raffinose/stachyose/melibiose transport system permease protein
VEIAFVMGIILPFQLAVIPLYVAMRHLGLVGNYLGMILLYGGLLIPLTVFLYTGFIRALPFDYEEAARVDGAGLFRIYFRVLLPLLRPVTGTVAVLTALLVWNDFFLSLIFLAGSRHETLPVALFSFVGEYDSQWNYMFAAVAISIAPILAFYLFAQRQLIKGFAAGVKG